MIQTKKDRLQVFKNKPVQTRRKKKIRSLYVNHTTARWLPHSHAHVHTPIVIHASDSHTPAEEKEEPGTIFMSGEMQIIFCLSSSRVRIEPVTRNLYTCALHWPLPSLELGRRTVDICVHLLSYNKSYTLGSNGVRYTCARSEAPEPISVEKKFSSAPVEGKCRADGPITLFSV